MVRTPDKDNSQIFAQKISNKDFVGNELKKAFDKKT